MQQPKWKTIAIEKSLFCLLCSFRSQVKGSTSMTPAAHVKFLPKTSSPAVEIDWFIAIISDAGLLIDFESLDQL